MRGLVFTCVILFTPLLTAGEARIVIADGATSDAEAQKKLAQLKLPAMVRLPAGFPKVLASETIKGLNPGLHIVVLGFCPSEDRVRIKTGEANDVRMYFQLKHHAYLLKQLKRSAKGVYSKQVTTDTTVDCPMYMFPEPKKDKAAWAAVQQVPTSADAWVAFGQQLEAAGDFSGADYAYSVAFERDPTSQPAQSALYKLDLVGARDL